MSPATLTAPLVLAADPLLDGAIGPGIVGIVLIKVVMAFILLLVSVMLMVWFERKLVEIGRAHV